MRGTGRGEGRPGTGGEGRGGSVRRGGVSLLTRLCQWRALRLDASMRCRQSTQSVRRDTPPLPTEHPRTSRPPKALPSEPPASYRREAGKGRGLRHLSPVPKLGAEGRKRSSLRIAERTTTSTGGRREVPASAEGTGRGAVSAPQGEIACPGHPVVPLSGGNGQRNHGMPGTLGGSAREGRSRSLQALRERRCLVAWGSQRETGRSRPLGALGERRGTSIPCELSARAGRSRPSEASLARDV